MRITATSTDLSALVFYWMAQQWQEKLNMQVFDLPLGAQSAQLYMSWHTTKNNDPGIKWLKHHLLDVIQQDSHLPDCNH